MATRDKDYDYIYGKYAPPPNKKLKPEFDTMDFVSEKYPKWQAVTESIKSLVMKKKMTLNEALKKYNMRREEYEANLKKLEKNNGGEV